MPSENGLEELRFAQLCASETGATWSDTPVAGTSSDGTFATESLQPERGVRKSRRQVENLVDVRSSSEHRHVVERTRWERGASLVEWALLAALVAILVIAVVHYMRAQSLRSFCHAGNSLVEGSKGRYFESSETCMGLHTFEIRFQPNVPY